MLWIFIAIILGLASEPGEPALAASPKTDVVTASEAEAAPGYEAEDQTPSGKFTTATEIKPIIEVTRANWVAVRRYEGQDLLYVSHLAAWRCGMHEIRIGINGAAPEKWDLPECQLGIMQPNRIPDDGALKIYRAYPLDSVKSVSVEILFDDMTEAKASFERAAISMN